MIDLQELADKLGIARDFTDSDNVHRVISPECRVQALSMLGFSINDEGRLQSEIREFIEKEYRDMLPPVTVLRDGEHQFIYINTPEDLNEEANFSYHIRFENGQERGDSFPLYEIEIARYADIYGTVYDTRRMFAPTGLDYGYHTFTCEINDNGRILKSSEMTLIVTPKQCYIPDQLRQGKKLWGLSVQLYALRSKGNWGIGDFADLQELLDLVARHGGGFVGINPIHAGYPSNPDPDMISPYSPSSRKWLNVIYIRVENVPEYTHCQKAMDLVQSDAFQQKIRALKDREYVDYRHVLDLKLKALREIFDTGMMTDKRNNRARQFLEFVERGGESLMRMAAYDALQAHFYANGQDAWGWMAFPNEYQDVNSYFVKDFIEAHQHDVHFYCYLQFLAQEQLDWAFDTSRNNGMALGIYRDLAVGVTFGSCDVWADSDNIYSKDGSSIGAPPDTLGPKGQNWGLAPLNPNNLRATRYKEYINLYRSNMRSCGALRIDHAAGINRYWVVPPGKDATDGVYIKNNLNDILGIIALESMRNKCLIIAEDLGTIPPELRRGLKESCMYSYKLFFGERAWDGGYIAPRDYEPIAMSALTTHDMPTLKGWWGFYDLTLGQELGIYTQEQAEKLKEDRIEAKQQILNSLHGLGSIDDSIPRDARECELTQELADGMQVHMCRGACVLYSSQLEDWIGVEKPMNIPGTFREYPNWRRKLTMDIDDIFALDHVRHLTEAMTQARSNS